MIVTKLLFVIFVLITQGECDYQGRKRALGDYPFTTMYNNYLTPYGIYPGIKPLMPFKPLIPSVFRPVTPSPAVRDFKTKKDDFLNKLFDDMTLPSDDSDLPSGVEVRSVVTPSVKSVVTTPIPTTPKPKIDPSVFISKKFDFLSKLLDAINSTTTPDPTAVTDTSTVKPTIVPPGFWVPLPPSPSKTATKATKPAKFPPKSTETDTLDDTLLLKQLIADLSDDSSTKTVRAATFLDKLLHKEPDETTTPSSENSMATRSLLPPGLWIPPYIYAAKMGIYLDKIFDTLDEANADGTK